MKDAPADAFFVWPVTGTKSYAMHLARHLGRDDLQIVSQVALDPPGHRFQGIKRSIVIDHACELTPRQRETHAELMRIVAIMKGAD